MTERELLVDCLRRLNGAAITYYLTGSMASNYWGVPRTTHDLDFVIQLPPQGLTKWFRPFLPIIFWTMLRSVPLNQLDNIVGKKTTRELDRQMRDFESNNPPVPPPTPLAGA